MQRFAHDDPSSEINCVPGDSSSLLAGMNEMQETLRHMVEEIVRDAEQLSSASSEMLETFKDISLRTRRRVDLLHLWRLP